LFPYGILIPTGSWSILFISRQDISSTETL
jgi:hypothetical protein